MNLVVLIIPFIVYCVKMYVSNNNKTNCEERGNEIRY
jgi:hypothetical protein